MYVLAVGAGAGGLTSLYNCIKQGPRPQHVNRAQTASLSLQYVMTSHPLHEPCFMVWLPVGCTSGERVAVRVGGTRLALLAAVQCVCLKSWNSSFKITGEAFRSFSGERIGLHKRSHNGFL